MPKKGAEKGERNEGLSREECTSQLVHCESNTKTIWLFVMLLYYIDFVLGRNSKVINVYCSKAVQHEHLVLSSSVIKMA